MNAIVTAICVTGIIVAALLGMRPADSEQLQVRTSTDGRAVCYLAPRTWYWESPSMSCLPVWLLEKPNNWVVMYPHSTPTGKVKKNAPAE